eukprot:5304485-Pyramimonas_sp.AAC.1
MSPDRDDAVGDLCLARGAPWRMAGRFKASTLEDLRGLRPNVVHEPLGRSAVCRDLLRCPSHLMVTMIQSTAP